METKFLVNEFAPGSLQFHAADPHQLQQPLVQKQAENLDRLRRAQERLLGARFGAMLLARVKRLKAEEQEAELARLASQPEVGEYLAAAADSAEVELRLSVWNSTTPRAFLLERSCGHAAPDRRCAGCGARLCPSCGPEVGGAQSCRRCGRGPVWADNELPGEETPNPEMRGY